MDSFDYTLVVLTAAFVLLGLTLIYLTVRSFVKIWQSRGLDSGWMQAFKRAAAAMLVAGIILVIHFWLLNPHNDPDSVSYNPAGITAGLSLMTVGVILTYLILPFHRKQVNKAKWPWPRRHKVMVGLCLLLAVVIGVVVYQQLALRQNREAFMQARSAIDTVYADIVKQVGQPDNYRRTNDCSRPSQEFEPGPLSCSVSTDFIYGVDNEQQANTIFKQIQSVIAVHPQQFKPTQPLSSSIGDVLAVNTYYHAAGDSYRNKQLPCRLNYVFNTPREIDLTIHEKLKYPFEITMSCYGPARALYYPLNE